MTDARAFVGLGSNEGEPHAHLTAALAALDGEGVRVAGAGRLVWTPYVGAPRGTLAPRVLNTVAEVRTTLDPRALLARLQAIEASRGRVRDGRLTRALDLDLLAYDDVILDTPELTLPHPRCTQRAFVLSPWVEVAPLFEIPGTGATVVEHAATLARDEPAQQEALKPVAHPPYADRAAACTVLPDRAALDAWRAEQGGTLGVVMTMGALHEGHAALVQRAAAECDAVVATLFVNPTQFAPGDDLARYPRTFDADVALLRRHGAAAVYAPDAADMYPDGPTTDWVPSGAARGYEGAERPDHFAGVATVVGELWRRTRAHRSYFGRKDAQQLAVLRQVRRERGLDVEVIACPIVRALDHLALSSRNRYLGDQERLLARELSTTLSQLGHVAARGIVHDGEPAAFDPVRDLPAFRAYLAGRGLTVDYLDLVDADTMQPQAVLDRPLLAMAAVRLGSLRLLDNRWLAPPVGASA
ncbi:MAG: pantoate--beta-alanine ligase [Planctomycetota bacterium]|nr:pantoate--beta-alanine ligase [Planctomycetota bacterium]